MKILCLYNNACAVELFEKLREMGHEIVCMEDRLDEDFCRAGHFDLTVSYTYRYILTGDLLEALGGNVVNIHNSMLPWNRGADPNLWSIAEGTPRGVTLHYMDEALDKGYIIMQKEVCDDLSKETLKSSYNNLDAAAKELFIQALACYNDWRKICFRAEGKGSYHSVKDGSSMKECIDTYDMPVPDFLQKLKARG